MLVNWQKGFLTYNARPILTLTLALEVKFDGPINCTLLPRRHIGLLLLAKPYGDLSLQRDIMSELPGNHHVEVGHVFSTAAELSQRPSTGCQPVTASSCRGLEACCDTTAYHKTSNTSWVSNRSRVSNTSRVSSTSWVSIWCQLMTKIVVLS